MYTKYLDPDFRRTPKTQRWCCVCQRDLKSLKNARKCLTINGGTDAVWPEPRITHGMLPLPESERTALAEAKWMFIGADCAAKIGEGWTLPIDEEDH